MLILKHQIKKRILVPLVGDSVTAGFPSPAGDFIERSLDLNEYLITHPAATFFVRVSGHSMVGAHILDGDLLIVDKAVTPKNNDIIVACLNGEFTVKYFHKEGNSISLIPANPLFKKIIISEESDFQVWGVVVYVIHKS